MHRLLGRLDPLVAPCAINAIDGDRLDRACLGTLQAIEAPLVQAGFRVTDQRVVAQRRFGDQAPQPPGAPFGRNELGVDPEAAQP